MNRDFLNSYSFQQEDKASEGYHYNNWRERFVTTTLRIVSLLGVGLTILSFTQENLSVQNRIIYPILLVILLAITFIRTPYNIRVATLLIITFAVGISRIITLGTWTDASIFLLAFIVLSSLLLDNNANLYALGISFITVCAFAFLHQIGFFVPTSPLTPAITMVDWAIFIASFTASGIVAIVAIHLLKQEFERALQQAKISYQNIATEKSQLEGKIRERTDELENRTSQLKASTNIARTIGEIQNVPDLLSTSVDATAEQFGFYQVGIYLLDSQKQVAFLQAASSTIGKELIGLGHRVNLDTKNAINIVVEKKSYYAASDIGGALFIKDPNFPITRSRVVVPLAVRGEIMGVLDMHSDQLQNYGEQDVEVFQTLADLIAISIDNVRLIGETQTLVEQLSFYNSTQTLDTWTKSTNRRSPAYQYTPAGIRPIFTQLKKEDNSAGSLFIPLILQGQKIGNIKLRRKGYSMSWSDKEKLMVEKIAEQISLALENSRLVDEAQKNAQRDQLIANISTRVRETLDVDAVVRTATTEFRKVFDLKEAEISIGLPQAEPKPIRKNTSALRLR